MTVLDPHTLAQPPMPPTPLRCSPDTQISPFLPQDRSAFLEPMDSSNDEASTENISSKRSLTKDIGFMQDSVSLKKQNVASGTSTRGRRKSRWKLKFHHQALPPEYLKHYKQQEKKRRQTETKKAVVEKVKSKKPKAPSEVTEIMPVETVLHQVDKDGLFEDEPLFPLPDCLQSVSEDAEDINSSVPRLDNLWQAQNLLESGFPNLNIDLSQNKAFLENLLSNQIEINRVERQEKHPPLPKPEKKQRKPKVIPPSGRIMNYSDLPYMGEITLDGIKPRRGRKPKKADICHLIYKNYGQIFPGAPNSVIDEVNQKVPPKWKSSTSRVPSTSGGQLNKTTLTQIHHPKAESPLPSVSGLINHTEVQNRIINSLLERRLTQEFRNKAESLGRSTEEPLNLCLRDLKPLKIKLSRKHGNFYEAKSPEQLPKASAEIKKEVIDVESDDSSAEDAYLAPFNLVTTELRESSDDDSCMSLGSQVTLSKVPEKSPSTEIPGLLVPQQDPPLNWLNPNYFPMANYPSMPMLEEMYYQKMNAIKAQHAEKKKETHPAKPKSSLKRLSHKANPSSSQKVTKRKRSAIFIPPVPTESTANPTTEVSICKFKFTGGAKPSLQEKKMLSVDSGGNFRYYSGTGDKSMRGYEYFPRESLQQCQESTGCSPSGVFLTASALGSGEKIPEDVGHSGFFDPTFPFQLTRSSPEAPKQKPKKNDDVQPSVSVLRDHLTDNFNRDDEDDDSDNSLPTTPSPAMDSHRDDKPRSEDGGSRRARRSRKSIAREKLEQTFKEKGFLIQTQQLESAEGATYCKFRQLRKFTRYLFRSWKDYLPGNVRDLSMDAGVSLPEVPDQVKMEVTDS